jgi:hypothetical protein
MKVIILMVMLTTVTHSIKTQATNTQRMYKNLTK